MKLKKHAIRRAIMHKKIRLPEEELKACRTKIKETILTGNDKYRRITENMSDLACETDAQGYIRYVSPSHKKILGYAEEELLGKTVFDFTHPDDLESVKKDFFKAAQSNDFPLLTHRIRHAAGHYVWVEFFANPFHDEAGNFSGVTIISRDITKHKQAEEKLKTAEETYRNLFLNAQTGLFRADIKTGLLLEANDCVARFMGFQDREELLSKPFNIAERYVDPEAREEVISLLQKNGQFSNYEARFRSIDGNILWMRYSAKIIKEKCWLEGVCEDVTQRRSSEEELHRLNTLMNSIFENIPNMIFLKDANELRFVKINKSGEDLLGYSNDYLLGKNDYDFFPKKQADFFTSVDREVLRNNQIIDIREEFIQTGDKGIRILHTKKASLLNTKGEPEYLLGISEDITERKQTEEELRKNGALLFSITQKLPCVIYQFYVTKDGEYGVSYAGERMQEIFEIFQDEENKFAVFASHIHPDDSLRFHASITKAVTTVTLWDFEGRYIKSSGETIWFHGLSTPTAAAEHIVFDGILLDTTGHKQSAEQARLAEEKFSKIFMTTPDCIVISRIMDGAIIDVNQGFESVAGWRREEVLGKSTIELNFWVNAADRQQMVKDLLEGQDIFSRETTVRRKEGNLLNVIYSARPITIANESCLIFVLQDITSLRRIEDERRKLELQLMQSQKMDAIGKLAGGIAHDFNNMLGIILGHAEIVLMNATLPVSLKRNLEEIQKAADRSANLTRQLLAFARKQNVMPKLLDLNQTVEGMLKMLRRLIGENIELSWHPGKKLWKVKMDPSQIDQILANLCVNARDAITGGGKIIIETANAVLDKAAFANHPEAAPGEYVFIAVSDSGCGMDKTILDELFEPFFTTKAVGKGTGLGLATIYGIVNQNNGFISVYSEPGRGSIFKIYLPRHLGNTEQTLPEENETPIIGGRGVVLLVEDEPALLNMTATMLEHLGYTVLPAATPQEATRIAKSYADKIHLFMTDVIMPEMNGRDLSLVIASLHPNIRLLFMSGYTADIIAHQGVLDEGVHFLQKPFSLTTLAAKMRQVLG